MRTCADLPEFDASPDYGPEAETLNFIAQVARMVAVTQALVSRQRQIDIQGLQDHVGLLCAKALDLPPSRTGFVKLELKRLSSALDALTASLRMNTA